ncbi:hypothetical protein MIND_00300000 [Mycena indigotica]|uniref:Uncharacterized protein n=1 Tax=Mycena indigotica TaxID=2126181 RepID=A0A8H6T3N4_9AGAR|nr:uncharacterized protein MIND_00300000 [Mycena indigotica]KAF7309297.1 hypothetical protein MIND_00300000 [Mycena indigotica]
MRRGNMPLYPQRVSRGTTAGLGQRCPARTFRGQRRSAALERKRILVLQGRRTRQERLARHILDALDPSPRAMYSAFAVDRVVHTIDSVGLLLQLLKRRTSSRTSQARLRAYCRGRCGDVVSFPQMQRGGHSAVVKANPRSTSFTAALDEAGTVAILPGWLVVGTAVSPRCCCTR